MKDIWVVGAGGHAKVVLATLHALKMPIRGLLDDRPELWGKQILEWEVMGGLDGLNDLAARAVIAIGSNQTRHQIATRFPAVQWVSAIHPLACVHSSARVGEGTVVFAGVVVQPDAYLGRHVIVNTAATLDHDARADDFVHVAPGVHLAGNVHLGEGVFMGISSSAVPGVRVGSWSTVGAGAVVISDIAPNTIAVGVPARSIQKLG